MVMSFHFLIFLLPFLATLACAKEADEAVPTEAPSVPNIGFLGRGYDIVRGNPRPLEGNPVDSGIRSPVFDMTNYSAGRLTADMKRSVPDAADVIECATCMTTFQSDIISGAKSYKQSLKQQLDIKRGGPFAFRASKSYQRILTETNTYRNVLIDSMTSCIAYCADVVKMSAEVLNPTFRSAVADLPAPDAEDSKDKYLSFIEQFGTHYIAGLTAGSLHWQRLMYESSNYHKMVQELSTSGVESFATKIFIDDLNVGEKYGKGSAGSTREAISAVERSIGAAPPEEMSNTSVWQEESAKRPMPVYMKLLPITSLFTLEMFPEVPGIDLERNALDDMIQGDGYCKYLARANPDDDIDCSVDELPDSLQQQPTGVFGGTYYLGVHTEFPNIANPFTDKYDCPSGFKKHFVTGGTAGIAHRIQANANVVQAVNSQPSNTGWFTSWSTAEIPQVQSQAASMSFDNKFSGASNVAWSGWSAPPRYSPPMPMYNPGDVINNILIPGQLYMCLSSSWDYTADADPEGTFGGMYILANNDCKVSNNNANETKSMPNPVLKSGAACPTGYEGVKVAEVTKVISSYYQNLCEIVVACYRHAENATLGGFFLRPTQPNNINVKWVNPATGVISCPDNYFAHLLFSWHSSVGGFKSYYCLKNN